MDNLARYITERKPRHVAVTTDEDWRPDWRVELIPSYKEHRTGEPVPPALIPQMPIIMECFEAIGVEATRVYRVDEAREFLAGKGVDADAIAPQVDGKFMSALVRARKPTRRG